jgi:MFS superfamily sulfate permease-like transporter
MTLAATVTALVLFAFACGLTVGVLVAQAWHEHRADEESVP